MNKASEWARNMREATDALSAFKSGRPQTNGWTPECLLWEAKADNAGNLVLGFQKTFVDDTTQASTRVAISANHALILARWILDTFAELEPPAWRFYGP